MNSWQQTGLQPPAVLPRQVPTSVVTWGSFGTGFGTDFDAEFCHVRGPSVGQMMNSPLTNALNQPSVPSFCQGRRHPRVFPAAEFCLSICTCCENNVVEPSVKLQADSTQHDRRLWQSW